MLLLLALALAAPADTIHITRYDTGATYQMANPVAVDSTDAKQKAWSAERLLDASPAGIGTEKERDPDGGKASADSLRLTRRTFRFDNTGFTKAKISVSGAAHYRLYVDGQKADTELSLLPKTHTATIDILGPADSLAVSLIRQKGAQLTPRTTPGELYSQDKVIYGRHVSQTNVSPDGRFAIISYYTSLPSGKTDWEIAVRELATGRVVDRRPTRLEWMPRTTEYYYTRETPQGRSLISCDPATGKETVRAANLPDGEPTFAPTEDWLLITQSEEADKERTDLYRVLAPDDRQPGWRTRTNLAKYDLATGILQPLTFGYHNTWATDISPDGRYLLTMTAESRLTQRPTELHTLAILDTKTLQSRTLAERDGFISGAVFSPDGRQILITGSAECLGGVGKRLPEGLTPSTIDTQLYVMTLSDGTVRPLTADFDPNVVSAEWSAYDHNIYIRAERRDYISLYRCRPDKDYRIEMIAEPEDCVQSFTAAAAAPVMLLSGQSAGNASRWYALNAKTLKPQLQEDLSAQLLKDVELGPCLDYNFKSSRGDTIYGRYYLPPHFDKTRQWPMLVYYYGGCSPTSRYFGGHYPFHRWAALGYVVYVIQPSGATGFGQEFAARHVNTAGQGPAEDIIEGTRKFASDHAWINAKKIGCLGASYGGFMTQYLQTVTDIFAAAVSHAGISSHTSYWGNGYWGYSYSETSMADSYPWTDPKLYAGQSPLYRADKIHTPLLFLHGDADTNVPTAESIQMFTALKLLGRETAFVEVSGENHGIMDLHKRIRWQNTMMAWFAKYLQDDDTWWEYMYPTRAL